MLSNPPPRHWNTDFCNILSPVVTAALQDRPAAGLHHCNNTYEDLLCTQVLAIHHQGTATLFFCNMHSPVLSAALQDRLAANLYHCHNTYEGLLFIQMLSNPPPRLCNTVFLRHAFPTAQWSFMRAQNCSNVRPGGRKSFCRLILSCSIWSCLCFFLAFKWLIHDWYDACVSSSLSSVRYCSMGFSHLNWIRGAQVQILWCC